MVALGVIVGVGGLNSCLRDPLCAMCLVFLWWQDALNKYVSGFQDSPSNNNRTVGSIRFYLRIITPSILSALKNNIGFFGWLKRNRY